MADVDGDGVGDDLDLCPDTSIPEVGVPSAKLRKKRWALTDDDGVFDTAKSKGKGHGKGKGKGKGHGKHGDDLIPFTVVDTGGCSCEQILQFHEENGGRGIRGQRKHGCKTRTLERWIDDVAADADRDGFAPPEDCDDLDPHIHPDAPEVCDGLDNDCDGVVDPDGTCEPPPLICADDADCVMTPTFCDGCFCDPLHVDAPEPVCNGNIVQCFQDPCAVSPDTAACVDGRCTATSCDDGEQNGDEEGVDCGGSCPNACEVSPIFCGGIAGLACPDGHLCVDDPSDDCSAACDAADCLGICVIDPQPQFCGGIAAILCPDGLTCVDDPNDACDPDCGGADCGGRCAEGNGQFCGGIAGFACPEGFNCLDSKGDACSPRCGGADCGGFCVRDTNPPQCAGFPSIECPDGLSCFDQADDLCEPACGDADCPGTCLELVRGEVGREN